jgi:hypothetical protein
MNPRRFRSSSTSRFAGVRQAVTIEEAIGGVKSINKRVRRERAIASSAAREAHLRLLMGLPAVRSLIDDRHEADA